MKHTRIKFFAAFLALIMAMLTFAGCGGDKLTDKTNKTDPGMSESKTESSTPAESSETTDVQPETLEQELLKKRGIAFDNSDYKKFIGGEGLIDSKTLFSNRTKIISAASAVSGSVFLAGSKIYKYSCKDPLSNGKNCIEVGTLPKGTTEDIIAFHDWSLDDTQLLLYYSGNAGCGCYELNATTYDGPYTVDDKYADKSYKFKNKYLYENDTKTLIDEKAFPKTVKQFTDDGTQKLLLTKDGTLYKIRNSKYYYKMDLSFLESGEEIVRLYNDNIIMTTKAYYEVFDAQDFSNYDPKDLSRYYASEGIPEAPDYRLKKIELLDKYYDEVLTISQTHLITKDYTMLPLTELTFPGGKDSPASYEYMCGKIRNWALNEGELK